MRGWIVVVAILAWGCAKPKPVGYTRFPQALIPPPGSDTTPASTPSIPPAAGVRNSVPLAIRPTVPPTAEVAPAAPAAPATLPGVAATPAVDPEPWTPIVAWSRSRGLPTPEILAGSRAVRIGGIVHHLGFEPVDQGGAVCIHPLDRIKTFEPLLQPTVWPSPRTVVLDPGHGGSQAGTRSLTGNRFEKDLTLDWALRLKPLLEARGWTVHLTRTNDLDLPLTDRVRMAETLRAGLFISLHFNSSFPSTQARGLETYCLTPCGMASTTTRVYADDAGATHPNNRHDEANLLLARRIHRHVLAATGTADRGIRRARFMEVLRGQDRPAVLVEGGFLSHPDESRAINTPAYRQRLAEGVARALE